VRFLTEWNRALTAKDAGFLAGHMRFPLRLEVGGETTRIVTLTSAEGALAQVPTLLVSGTFLEAAAAHPAEVTSGTDVCGDKPGTENIDWTQGSRAVARAGDTFRVTFRVNPCWKTKHYVSIALKREANWIMIEYARQDKP
jgi:hypothetical protein